MTCCRLLPFSIADGPHNMAADETLLDSAAAGIASLRFYGWEPPTLSLGYFQPEHLRLTDPLLANLPFVRRPSGGDTLVHDREITYALALPAGVPWHNDESWVTRMHGIIVAALADLGVAAHLQGQQTDKERFTGVLCFHHWTPGDLILETGKVVGSAQRRQRGALMQHGAVLLGRSRFTPSLPGILEQSGLALSSRETIAAIEKRFAQATGWSLERADWQERERDRIEELVNEKYGRDEWNKKR